MKRSGKVFNFIPERLNGSVLTVQSHVVHGYVGNKASCTVLQILGFEVKNINSVHFSNHSGYPILRGTRMSGSQLKEIFEGLTKNNLLNDITHIQTGYIGSKEFLYSMLEIVKELKKINPNIVYLCDPVIGDLVLRNGILKKEIYVPKELVEIYKNEIIMEADIITPNQMEIELISGIEIKNEKDVRRAIEIIHEKGVQTVVVTSCDLEEEGILALYASHKSESDLEMIRIDFERKKGYYSGVGDTIASLLLAWMHMDNDFVLAIEKAFNTVQCMVDYTNSGEELKIIQCRRNIEKPIVMYKSKKIV